MAPGCTSLQRAKLERICTGCSCCCEEAVATSAEPGISEGLGTANPHVQWTLDSSPTTCPNASK
eukprot:5862028-Amphidinium_carterae.1